MNRFNNRVPEFVVPKVPPKIDRVTSKDFKKHIGKKAIPRQV